MRFFLRKIDKTYESIEFLQVLTQKRDQCMYKIEIYTKKTYEIRKK